MDDFSKGEIVDPGLAFGKVLRQVRRNAKLTQEQLAHSAGLDRSYISLIERGERQPTVRVIFDLARAIGTTPRELITLTEELVLTA